MTRTDPEERVEEVCVRRYGAGVGPSGSPCLAIGRRVLPSRMVAQRASRPCGGGLVFPIILHGQAFLPGGFGPRRQVWLVRAGWRPFEGRVRSGWSHHHRRQRSFTNSTIILSCDLQCRVVLQRYEPTPVRY
ncbi:hypothetical protein MRX96_011620 [Rhipicephalus microplus]